MSATFADEAGKAQGGAGSGRDKSASAPRLGDSNATLAFGGGADHVVAVALQGEGGAQPCGIKVTNFSQRASAASISRSPAQLTAARTEKATANTTAPITPPIDAPI
jgi:hypothetical protein